MDNSYIERNQRDDRLLTDDEYLLSHCLVDFFKSTGKGGQKKNKTSSAARIVHKASKIEAVSGNRRSQKENRIIALRQLKLNLALHWRQLPAVNHGLDFGMNEKNVRFPLLVGSLIDSLWENGWNPAPTAKFFGTSTAQIVKLLKKHPVLWQYVNQKREQKKMKKLT